MAGRQPTYEVLLTAGAEKDLEAIYDYIEQHHGAASAGYVLDGLSKVVEGLSRFPLRGGYPKELVVTGIREFRQASFKPYRVICRIMEMRVVIYLIVDGRRDLQSILARRLLGA